MKKRLVIIPTIFLSFIIMFLTNFVLATDITDCYNITTSGTYVLQNDIIRNGNLTCINITVPNVIVDCDNHLINGTSPRTSESKAIYVGNGTYEPNMNVTIKNCYVDYFMWALYSVNVSKVDVINFNVTMVQERHKVWIENGSYFNFTNVAMGEGAYGGISGYCFGFRNSSHNTLENVSLDYCNTNGGYGIYSDSGSSNHTYNRVNISNIGSETGHAIHFAPSCNNHTLSNIRFWGNTYDIVFDNGGNDTTIVNMSSESVEGTDSWYSITVGGKVSNVTLAHSTFLGEYDHCVLGFSGGFDATGIYWNITNNLFNVSSETKDESLAFVCGDGIQYSELNLNTTKHLGERIFGNGLYVGGNYYTNSSGTGFSDTCSDSNFDGICDDSYTFNASPATTVTDYLPFSSSGDEYVPYFIPSSNHTFQGNTLDTDNSITYSPTSNISFQIQGSDTSSNLANMTFEFDGNNYTKLTNPEVYNDTSNNFWINFTSQSAGNKNFRWYAEDTSGYWNSTDQVTLTIGKASTSISLLFNNSNSNITKANNTVINITANTSNSQVLANISGNYTYAFSPLGDYGKITNITTFRNSTDQAFNITAFTDGNENYTGSSLTRYIFIDVTPPCFANYTPPNMTSGNTPFTQSFNTNVTDRMSGIGTVYLQIGGTNYSTTNVTYLFQASRTFSVGTYSYNWWANDTVGNENTSETYVITVYDVGSGVGGGGGGGGGSQPFCGNAICEAGEDNKDSANYCPSDCITVTISSNVTFDVDPLVPSLTFFSKGLSKPVAYTIKNLVDKEITINVSFFGNFTQFAETETDTITLKPLETKTLTVVYTFPSSFDNGIYEVGVKFSDTSSNSEIQTKAVISTFYIPLVGDVITAGTTKLFSPRTFFPNGAYPITIPYFGFFTTLLTLIGTYLIARRIPLFKRKGMYVPILCSVFMVGIVLIIL